MKCDNKQCKHQGEYAFCNSPNPLYHFTRCMFYEKPNFNPLEHFTFDEGENTENLIKFLRKNLR